MKWSDLTPEQAQNINCTTRPDLDPPLNESQEPCPWPWDPQQLAGAPLGQYHCPYCGAMVLAGVPHLDYREEQGSAKPDNSGSDGQPGVRPE